MNMCSYLERSAVKLSLRSFEESYYYTIYEKNRIPELKSYLQGDRADQGLLAVKVSIDWWVYAKMVFVRLFVRPNQGIKSKMESRRTFKFDGYIVRGKCKWRRIFGEKGQRSTVIEAERCSESAMSLSFITSDIPVLKIISVLVSIKFELNHFSISFYTVSELFSVLVSIK